MDGCIRVMRLRRRMGNQMVPVEQGAAAVSRVVEHHAQRAVANSHGDSSVGERLSCSTAITWQWWQP